MKPNLKSLIVFMMLFVAASAVKAQYGQMPPLHVDGKYLKDPHGNIVNLHGVMDTPNPYFNNYRWGDKCDNTTLRKCRTYFDKLFTAITDTPTSAKTAAHIETYPNMPSKSTAHFTAKEKIMFCLAMPTVFLAIFKATGTRAMLSAMSTASAASIAASEPSAPIAIPTSARARTGASFIPSPT